MKRLIVGALVVGSVVGASVPASASQTLNRQVVSALARHGVKVNVATCTKSVQLPGHYVCYVDNGNKAVGSVVGVKGRATFYGVKEVRPVALRIG